MPMPINVENTNHNPQPKPNEFALFAYGFRPFFFLAGAFAVLSITAWVGMYLGYFSLNIQSPPILWHVHEMLFGYTAATIAGFFLTVIPNWTSAKAQKGVVLMILTALWLLGRVVEWGQGGMPYVWVAAVDMSFLLVLTFVVARPLINKQYRRQLMFVPILLCLIASNAMMHMSIMGLGKIGIDWATHGTTLALDAVIVLITVMGGRVTPSFTSSFLGHDNPDIKVIQNPRLDRAVMIATWGLLIVDQAMGPSLISGITFIVVGILHFIRLWGWQGLRTLGQPILWVLHLGYLWLVIGLIFKGLADIGLVATASALHALAIGAIGTMTLGIMSRASLGHTGRAISPHFLTVVAYGLVSLSAAFRVAVAFIPDVSDVLVMLSGGLWVLGFLLFFIIYAPILMSPRLDGRPG